MGLGNGRLVEEILQYNHTSGDGPNPGGGPNVRANHVQIVVESLTPTD